ncbi:MAG: UDP-phosphate galactose phosphotransferase [Comamonadaceae bacterium 32-67-11]|nr:MAG: UDP-phosphate galactose phosphotransferase [Comamonadaceae bacterium 32-67-11]
MKRGFDLVLAVLAALVLLLPLALVALAVRLTSPGPALYWSERVGRNNRNFYMPKFRSMRTDTPAVATHLLTDPQRWLTPIGPFLRRSSLDELPQIWSILKGDMSFVGPRPALFNQHDLIALRTQAGVHHLQPGLTGWAQVNGRDELPIPIKPGLTGWAQVNGRDELPIPIKVRFDAEYAQRQSLAFDIKILWLTALKVLQRDGVAH